MTALFAIVLLAQAQGEPPVETAGAPGAMITDVPPEAHVSSSVLAARDTAYVGAQGTWSVGVFRPLTYAVRDGITIETYPLLFFAAPNFVVRAAHAEIAGWRVSGEYGFSVPTPAMRLSQGTLFPTWDESERRIGWFVVPRAGIVTSYGPPTGNVVTLRLDAAYGVRLSRNDATAPGGLAPLDILFAPALSTYRARVGTSYDASLRPWLRARAWANLWLHGRQPSPYTISAGGGVDVAVGAASRMILGFSWWNADTGAFDLATHEHHRSNDVYPSIDFVWAG